MDERKKCFGYIVNLPFVDIGTKKDIPLQNLNSLNLIK